MPSKRITQDNALGYVLVAPSYAEKGARNRRETLHKALLA